MADIMHTNLTSIKLNPPFGVNEPHRIQYNSQSLVHIGKQATEHGNIRLSGRVCHNVRLCKIQKKRKRGRRAGNSVKSRQVTGRGVEKGNLAVVKLVHDRIIHKILSEDHVNLCTVNIQSIRSKDTLLTEYLINNKIDLALVTETWLNDSDSDWLLCNELTQSGFTLNVVNREKRRGGGIALISTNNIKVSTLSSIETRFCKYGVWKIKHSTNELTLLGLYHPPPSPRNNHTNTEFVDEFVGLYADLSAHFSNIVIMGDFNIHMGKANDGDAISLRDSLRVMGLEQHVTFPTHRKGNILDLIVTEVDNAVTPSLVSRGDYLSDHAAVNVNLKWKRDEISTKTKRIMDWKGVDVVDLIDHMKLSSIEGEDLDELIDTYHVNATASIALLVPCEDKNIVIRRKFPWYTSEVREQKRIFRRREKIWRKYRLDHHWQALKRERNRYIRMLRYSRSNVLNAQIRDCFGDKSKLYNLVSSLTGTQRCNPLPDRSDADNARELSNFFKGKIERINDQLKDFELFTLDEHDNSIPNITSWKLPNIEELEKLILSMPNKQCEDDVLPTWIFKNNITDLNNFILRILDLSFRNGIFPKRWKNASVKPLLKKPNLDRIDPNYRPVSNLTFFSKILEKVVLEEFTEHNNANALMPTYQSAYRQRHSCETALIRLVNDILICFEKGHGVCISCVDLSAAFDTVNHDVLQNVLLGKFKIDDQALSWVNSYLSDRTFQVRINDTTSEKLDLRTGVPQGSCLGPSLYLAYASTLGTAVNDNMDIFGFADDHIFKNEFRSNNEVSLVNARHEMELTLSSVKTWMDTNRLKMNEAKTEYILFASNRYISKLDKIPLNVGGELIPVSGYVKYLGCELDSTLSFNEFVVRKCRKATINLRKISALRHMLTKESCTELIMTLVVSHLDYCNGILPGMTAYNVRRLQLVQNFAAKVICNKKKYDSASECMRELHWLPISKRIDFKILVTVHNCLHNRAPPYLSELIVPKKPTNRNLRSTSLNNLLQVPRTVRKTFASRSFSCYGPTLWNSLPDELRVTNSISKFRKLLKTYFFTQCYT